MFPLDEAIKEYQDALHHHLLLCEQEVVVKEAKMAAHKRLLTAKETLSMIESDTREMLARKPLQLATV